MEFTVHRALGKVTWRKYISYDIQSHTWETTEVTESFCKYIDCGSCYYFHSVENPSIVRCVTANDVIKIEVVYE